MEYGNRDLPVKRKRPGADKEDNASRIYIKDDDSGEESSDLESPECWKFWRESDRPPKIPLSDYKGSPPAYGQGAMYLCIIIGLAMFIFFVNNYNAKQLERIKEEYGMDTKPPVPELWWQHALSYNVIVRSFKDTNGDGIGDLNGVRSHINHFLYLGVDAIILSRMLESPFTDFGRDVSNFTAVDPAYGTLQDLQTLIAELHENGIKVLLELNPNHTSRKHKHFEASRRKQHPYEDYYVWHDGRLLPDGSTTKPNNWVNKYGGSAWTRDSVRNQYYYHYYNSNMPDLNYRHRPVAYELQNVLEFWMAHGIDGFYMDGAHVFYEVDDLELDEPETETAGVLPGEYAFNDHVYTEDQHDIHDLTMAMRDWIDQYSLADNLKIVLLLHIEDNTMRHVMQYYETGAHAPISRNLMQIDAHTDGRDLYELIDSYKTTLSPEREAVWMLSHPDTGLLSSKTGVLYQNVYNMLTLLLPGAAISYMGEELALPALEPQVLSDIYQTSREKSVACSMGLLPWNRYGNGGFSKVTPWLPAQPDYDTNNIELQMKESQRVVSPIQLYSKLASLRKEASFVTGETQYATVDNNIYSYMRFAKNSAPYLIVANIGSTVSTVDLTLTSGTQYGKIMAYATPVQSDTVRKSFHEGQTIDMHQVTLKPGEGLVLLLMLEIIMDMGAFT